MGAWAWGGLEGEACADQSEWECECGLLLPNLLFIFDPLRFGLP